MPLEIRDGTGRGFCAKVDNNNRIFVKSTVLDASHFANESRGDAYNIVVEQTPTGANDCFFYLKNDSDKTLHISQITYRSASAEEIQLKLGDSGTPAGGSSNVPVNLNTGSPNSADCTSQSGNDITGLSGGSVADKFFSQTTQYEKIMLSTILLQKNQTISLYAVTGAIALDVVITIYFGELDA